MYQQCLIWYLSQVLSIEKVYVEQKTNDKTVSSM